MEKSSREPIALTCPKCGRQPKFITTWEVTFPFSRLLEAFDAWQKWAPFAETRLSSNCTVLGTSIEIKGIFMGTMAELEREDLLEPITSVPDATSTLRAIASLYEFINSRNNLLGTPYLILIITFES